VRKHDAFLNFNNYFLTITVCKYTVFLNTFKIMFQNGKFVTFNGNDKIDLNGNTYLRSE
jgi:hypothetical protein